MRGEPISAAEAGASGEKRHEDAGGEHSFHGFPRPTGTVIGPFDAIPKRGATTSALHPKTSAAGTSAGATPARER